MSYVEVGCDRCGLRLPKYALQDWSREIEVGRKADIYRRYANGSVGVQQGGSTYKIEHQKLCPGCYSKAEALIRQEQEEAAARARKEREEVEERARRSRRTLFLTVSVVGLGILALVAGNSFVPKKQPIPDDQSAPGQTNSTSSNAEASVPVEASPAEPEQPASRSAENTEDAPVQEAANETQSVAVQSSPAADRPDGIFPTPETVPALSRAVASALESGAATPWRDGQMTGEISVGDVRYNQGHPCRSFNYTAGEKTSAIAYACAGFDGIWRPSRAFAR